MLSFFFARFKEFLPDSKVKFQRKVGIKDIMRDAGRGREHGGKRQSFFFLLSLLADNSIHTGLCGGFVFSFPISWDGQGACSASQ